MMGNPVFKPEMTKDTCPADTCVHADRRAKLICGAGYTGKRRAGGGPPTPDVDRQPLPSGVKESGKLMSFMIRRASPTVAVLATLLCCPLLQAQSLADAARRSQQHTKTAAKVYTNDNLPVNGTISVIGVERPVAPPESEKATAQLKEPAAASSSAAGAEDTTSGKSETAGASTSDLEPAERNAELQKSGAKIKEEISMLEREIDLLNREYRLRAATYYADAGNSLRNPKQWADQQRDHESQMKDKQAALDSAKQKFADLQEQARRVGVVIE
jgi:hypothetical protein